jgi:hypothetical protein
MKLLLTADLHYRRTWFDWLLQRAATYDLVAIAGDLLDLFSDVPPKAQVNEVQGLLRKLAALTRVAVCSGNHDAVGPVVPRMRGPVSQWFVALDPVLGIISDGRTETVGSLAVTTVPYYVDAEEKAVWLNRGRRVRAERGVKWLVLHHEPPLTPGAATAEATQARLALIPNLFANVELLTLSACNTAMRGMKADGREVESLGVMAQRKGAKAVIATLWPVADESTRQLMQEFYRLHATHPDLSKAEALQRAQVALLGRAHDSQNFSQFSHPYFWAPFVLIGNWK